MSASEELVRRIGKLRLEAELDAPETPVSSRPQIVNEIDAAIRVAASGGSAALKSGAEAAERRTRLKSLAPGVTVDASGVKPKPKQSREQALETMMGKLQGKSPEALANLLASDKVQGWSQAARELVEEAVERVEYAEMGMSDITTYDFDAEPAAVDELDEDNLDDDDVYAQTESDITYSDAAYGELLGGFQNEEHIY